MGSSANIRQPYYPPIDPSVPAGVAVHLKLIYTGLNQHDQILNTQTSTTPTTPSNSTPTGGGATGTITLAALTPSTGTQGSITVNNGLITSYTNPT